MLLVNFADTQTSVPVANFDEMMNGSGYNGTGSFRDFYLENSYGQLDVETTVVGWIQLPMSKLDYGTDDMTALIRDAIGLVDDEIDFRQFDNDGDGILDGLSIIHQGYGQEVTGSTQDIWSHSADLLADVQADGVRVRTYTIQPELLYDDIQKQRSYEARIRSWKRRQALAKDAGDVAEYAKATAYLKATRKELRGFLEDTGLPRRLNREQI